MINIIKMAFNAGCGLAALGAGLFYFMYKEWFTLKIFSTLTQEQTYSAFLYSLLTMFLAFTVSVIAHFYGKKRSDPKVSADNNSIAVNSSGKGNTININR